MKKSVKMLVGTDRRTWCISPVTKVVQSKKAYKRSREKKFMREEANV